jgi:dCMP deaminase
MTDRFKLLYMDLAKRVAELSYCDNKKVGCIIVDESGRNIIAFGFNGSPRGFDNDCECDGRTLPTTLHAESNALTKVARCHYSSENAILFTTTSPCIECSKLIIQSGIKEVYYSELYRNQQGIELLEKANIKVEHYE